MREIPQIAVDFIANAEKCRLLAYLDPAKVWTIGYGHTGGVFKGMSCTKVQAKAWLAEDLGVARSKLYACLTASAIAALTEHQWAALLSFVFNTGAKKAWTIWKLLNAGHYDQVPLQLMRFVYITDRGTGKSIKISGLVNRRAEEVKLWSTEEPGSVVAVLPSAVTVSADTPPAPVDPTPPGKSATIIVSALGAAASAAPMVDQARGLIAPYADHSAIVQKALGALATIGAILALTGLVLIWMKKREHRA